jgi:hypothetical protein
VLDVPGFRPDNKRICIYGIFNAHKLLHGETALGKTLIVIGLLLVAAGIFVMFRDSIPLIRHLGRLPGDISVERGNFFFYFPVATVSC